MSEIEIHDGPTKLTATQTVTATGKPAIQLIVALDDLQLGFQLTRERYARLGELLENPKDHR